MTLRRLQVLWPFPLLCLLLATRWMFADAWPDSQDTLASEGLAALLAAGGGIVFASLRRKGVEPQAQPWPWGATLAGAMLFAGLHAGDLAGTASPKTTDLLIALALTPVVMAIVQVARGEDGKGLSGTDLAPGLFVAAGLLLLLPQPSFARWLPDLVLVAAPVLAGVGATWVLPPEGEAFPLRRGALALAGATVLFAVFALKPPRTHPTVLATALDFAVLVLTLWSLARLRGRFAAEFAVVPLLFLLEGLVLERIRPSWQQTGGLLLVFFAAVWLLFGPREEERVEQAGLLR